jgi:drug/metabolite transporter (DMT)-like permease
MVLFLTALKDLDAIQAALSNSLITSFGVGVAAGWLGEKVSPAAIAGGVLVLGGTLLITVWEELRPRATPAESLPVPAPEPRT